MQIVVRVDSLISLVSPRKKDWGHPSRLHTVHSVSVMSSKSRGSKGTDRKKPEGNEGNEKRRKSEEESEYVHFESVSITDTMIQSSPSLNTVPIAH